MWMWMWNCRCGTVDVCVCVWPITHALTHLFSSHHGLTMGTQARYDTQQHTQCQCCLLLLYLLQTFLARFVHPPRTPLPFSFPPLSWSLVPALVCCNLQSHFFFLSRWVASPSLSLLSCFNPLPPEPPYPFRCLFLV
ncbi:MAG: hypothetical protein BYD32DRAFT_64197 [Podila humilis]|nr:MAG: hypothetical protein BYD32DRAFT_64197 [Podila humilis]